MYEPSILGKSDILNFLSPKSFKQCRKLYLVGDYFLRRDAYNVGMYESQDQSKQNGEIENTLELISVLTSFTNSFTINISKTPMQVSQQKKLRN